MVDLDELQKRTTRQSVLGGHGLDVVNMHGSDFDALIAELRILRARVDELERDARLGAVVREVVATGGVGSDEPDQLDGYAQSLADDHSMFGAAVIHAIADALREEMALTCEDSPTHDCDCNGCVRLGLRIRASGGDQ